MLVAFTAVFLAIPVPKLILDGVELLANATSGMCMFYLGALLFYSD
ncbi:MAG: hypothetical protein HFJ64_06270 [Eggerthellaceae bacterium]|nr:hypothetical protein [Eggerthellaceae bacterium]